MGEAACVVLTWGAGAFDVDLHMTGPSGNNDNSRFHIFYAATGSLDALPSAQLIRDCICRSGSEVILTTRLNQGGVYRISAFNFGNQSTTSTELSTNADLRLLIVRGGAAVTEVHIGRLEAMVPPGWDWREELGWEYAYADRLRAKLNIPAPK